MDSNKSKRVVVYCRVATQAQLDGDHALEAQSARLHEQAERLGYEIVGEVSEYEKGTTLDRDGWKRACQEAVEQKADILLVADLTRIARDPILWMQALRELSSKGVWIQSAAEPDAFRVNPFFTYGCRPESNGSLRSMNYGKLTAGTTKTAIDSAKPSEKGEIITYLSRMGDVLEQVFEWDKIGKPFFCVLILRNGDVAHPFSGNRNSR